MRRRHWLATLGGPLLTLLPLTSLSMIPPTSTAAVAAVRSAAWSGDVAFCEAAARTATPRSSATSAVVDLVTAWLDAARTADGPAFIRFVRERGPALLYGPDQWLELKEQLRGVRFCGVKSAAANGVDLWMLDTETDSYGIAHFTSGKAPADRIAFGGQWPSSEAPPGAPRPPTLTPAALVEAVRARAAERAADDRFAGAVLLARHGRVLFEHAYGLADRATRTPNTVDTEFRFGSMGKMFTAVAIMQLVQAGKVDVVAPIGRYLADYPNREVATKATIADLLTHTGGTGDIFGPEFDAHKARLRRLEDYVALYGARPPAFPPGSRVDYSNYGFILLGRIVEAVTGLSYDDYIRQHIFAPAGMGSTGNLPESTILPRRAVAYTGAGATIRRADDTLPLSGTSAGGGYSTVGDFNRFVIGLTSHRLLDAATWRILVDGGVRMADGTFVPYDFGGTMPGKGRYIGHGGGAPGQNGMLLHFLDSGYTVAVLANRDPAAADSIALFAAHRLPAR